MIDCHLVALIGCPTHCWSTVYMGPSWIIGHNIFITLFITLLCSYCNIFITMAFNHALHYQWRCLGPNHVRGVLINWWGTWDEMLIGGVPSSKFGQRAGRLKIRLWLSDRMPEWPNDPVTATEWLSDLTSYVTTDPSGLRVLCTWPLNVILILVLVLKIIMK